MPEDTLIFQSLEKAAAVLPPSLPTSRMFVEHNHIPTASLGPSNSFLLSPLGDQPPPKDRRDRQSSG